VERSAASAPDTSPAYSDAALSNAQ
jgi:hypothetical protein